MVDLSKLDGLNLNDLDKEPADAGDSLSALDGISLEQLSQEDFNPAPVQADPLAELKDSFKKHVDSFQLPAQTNQFPELDVRAPTEGELQTHALPSLDELSDAGDEDFVEYVMDTFAPTAKASLVQGMANLKGAVGRRIAGGSIEGDPADGLDNNLGKTREEMQRIANPFRAVMARLGLDLFEYGGEVEQNALDITKETTKDLEALGERADTFPKKVANFVAANTGSSVTTAIALGMLRSPTIVATGMAATAAAEKERQALEAGEGFKSAKALGFMNGLIEAGTETFSLAKLLKIGTGQSVIKDALSFLVREEGSEIAATTLESALDKLTIRPDMTAGEFLEDLALTAAGTPFTAGVQTAAFTGIRKTQKGIEKVVDSTIGKGKTPEFVDLGEGAEQGAEIVQQSQADIEALKAEILELGKQIIEEGREAGFQTDPADLREMLENRMSPDEVGAFLRAGSSQGSEHFRDLLLNRTAEEIEMRNPSGALIDMPKAGEVGLILPSRAAVKGIDSDRRRFAGNRQIEGIAKRRQQEFTRQHRIAQKTQNLLQSMVKKYAPEMRLVLDFSERAQSRVGGGYLGFQIMLPENIQMINLSPRTLTKQGTINPDNWKQVALHEFGHALISQKFFSQPEAVQEAIEQIYSEDLSRVQDMSVVEFQETFSLSGEIASFLNANKDMGDLGKLTMRDMKMQYPGWYQSTTSRLHIGFAEWLANNFQRGETRSPESKQFFQGLEHTLKKIQSEESHFLRNSTYEKFLSKVVKERDLHEAEQELVRGQKLYHDAVVDAAKIATGDATDGLIDTVNMMVGGTPNIPHAGRTGILRRSLDKFNWIIHHTAGLEQISQLNSHIPGVTRYYNAMQALWQSKMRWTAQANETIKDWLDGKIVKGKERRQAVSDFLFRADALSSQKERKLKPGELAELREEFQITDREMELVDKIWRDFWNAMTEVEQVLLEDLQSRLVSGDTVAIAKEIADVEDAFADMRNRHYMPHSRFGKFVLTGRAQMNFTDSDGRAWKKGEVVYFEAHYKEKQAMQALKKQSAVQGSRVKFNVGEVQDMTQELLNMPPALARLLKAKLDLTPAQRKEFSNLESMLAPGQGIKKRFIERKGIPGHSKNGLQVYADYMQKFAGHLARLKHAGTLQDSVAQMKKSAQHLTYGVKRERIAAWYSRHLDYMLNPANELSSLRALGFMHYLGFLPKAAFVNLTQVPLVTLPYLASKYNDVAALSAYGKAMAQMMATVKRGRTLSPQQDALLQELRDRGVIDESMATELAALGEGGFIGRHIGSEHPEFMVNIQKTLEYSAFMFQAAEKFNRNITALAAYDLAVKNQATHDEAVDLAERAVKDTQFEYARLNRPEMMRGAAKANIFMFWQYTTNMLWYMGMNKGAAARTLILLFLMAGAEGLPFAGDIANILDVVLKKLGTIAGWKDPKKGAREYLREMYVNYVDDPQSPYIPSVNTVMNGFGSNVMGAWDISTSLSMGNIIPFVEPLTSERKGTDKFAEATVRSAGAMANIPVSWAQALYSDQPSQWKRAEKVMPNFAKAITQSTRWAYTGVERDKQNVTIKAFSPATDIEDAMAIAGRALGFQSSELSAIYRQKGAIIDAEMYWSTRHASLTGHLTNAYMIGDKDEVTSAMNDIADFNKQVPYPQMMIQDIGSIIKTGIKKRLMRQGGLPAQRKFTLLEYDYKTLYPTEPTVDILQESRSEQDK